MKLFRNTSQIPLFINGCVATIGNFDGVHLGHQALLTRLLARAHELGLPAVVILFEPQPGEYFQRSAAPPRLTSLREKISLLSAFGVTYVYCLSFNQNIAEMTAEHFATHLLFSKLQVRHLLIGQDFRFGRARLGDVVLLQQQATAVGARVEVFSDFALAGERVSSTRIRGLLAQGEMLLAQKFLGRSYRLCGRVIYGAQRGRQWGIPTANMAMRRLSRPLSGVFCVQVKRANQMILNGVANIGTRPTLDGRSVFLEVHCLDFNESLYGEWLEVFFLHKIRDEKKFSAVPLLIQQIRDDIAVATAYFSKINYQITKLTLQE